jgi:hypothetical protein
MILVLLQISQAPQKLVGIDGLNLFLDVDRLLNLAYTSFCEHVGLARWPSRGISRVVSSEE